MERFSSKFSSHLATTDSETQTCSLEGAGCLYVEWCSSPFLTAGWLGQLLDKRRPAQWETIGSNLSQTIITQGL